MSPFAAPSVIGLAMTASKESKLSFLLLIPTKSEAPETLSIEVGFALELLQLAVAKSISSDVNFCNLLSNDSTIIFKQS